MIKNVYMFSTVVIESKNVLIHITDDGYFFVSRLKEKALVCVIEMLELPTGLSILSDEMIVIGFKQNCSKNIFCKIDLIIIEKN